MSETIQTQTADKKKERLVFIDVMRGIAVIWMIETHVVDVVLDKMYKTGFFYQWLNISNGFVAVSFLFCAGAGFWLAAMKKVDDYKHFRTPLFVYIRRLLVILIIAYCLHLPTRSFAGFFHLSPERWLSFFEIDILQTIVYTSFISLFLLMITPKLKYIPWLFGALSIFVFFYTPFVLAWDPFSTLPAFFATFLAKAPISKFPLFQWSGYFFGGVAVTALFMQSQNKRKIAWIFFIGGLIIATILYNARDLMLAYPYVENWWKGSPPHSFFRIAVSIFVFGLLYLIEDTYKKTKVGDLLRIAGQESLFLYVSHNMIVYGTAINIGLRIMFGGQTGYWGTLFVFSSVAVFCYIASYLWHDMKDKNLKRAQKVMIATGLCLLIIFLVNPA